MKKKKFIILTSALLSFIILSSSMISVFAYDVTEDFVATEEFLDTNLSDINDKTFNLKEQKYTCNATIDDNFEDNSVLVEFNNKTSLKLKKYTPNDFDKLGIIEVIDTTEDTVNLLKEKIADPTSFYNKYSGSVAVYNIDESKFNQVILLKLNVHDKQNVLDTIKELEKRDDVLIAQPNYIYTLDCVTASDKSVNVPFVSGHYGFIDFDKYPAVFPQKKAEKLPLDAETENQIKKDYADYCNGYDSTDYNFTVSDVSNVDYYGTLSDGSMLVFCDILGTKYLTKVDTQVIGKYIYEVYTAGMDVMIYKNHQFTGILDEYLKGEVSDDLLDEIADILYFGKFVINNSSSETKPTTVQDDSAKSVSTADTARNITGGNNANGSIPTGQSNSIILFVGLLTLVSGFAFVCIEKRKGH